MNFGTIYIVGTPIGNLEDTSFRAIRLLKEVSLIAAEDTRHTKKLLTHFNIHTPLDSYHKFSEKRKFHKFIKLLGEGKDIALVTNAGMPGISDPGEILIREAIKNNVNVIPIPGPSAFILALTASGLSTDKFTFEGFLPRKKGERIKTLYSLKEEHRTMIFYEAGNRLINTLTDMKNIWGDRPSAIAKEITKKFEEYFRGKFSIILDQISTKTIKGEFVIVVEGIEKKPKIVNTSLKEEIRLLQKELGISSKEAIKLVSAKCNIPKREVYKEWIR